MYAIILYTVSTGSVPSVSSLSLRRRVITEVESRFPLSVSLGLRDFVHCATRCVKDRSFKFSLTSVRFDRELRNKLASLPRQRARRGGGRRRGGGKKRYRAAGRDGILATFDSIFSPKSQTPGERERKRARTAKKNF